MTDWSQPYEPAAPPTERSGFKVGDLVVITGLSGTEWSAEVIGFNALPNDVIVRWADAAPGLARENTISRSHVRGIRLASEASR